MIQFFKSLIWQYLLEFKLYKSFDPVILLLRVHPGRRGKIMFRNKPHNCQRRSEGSNKPCAHQDPETPQRLSQTCLWVLGCLLQRYRSAVACGRGRGSGCRRPGFDSRVGIPWRREMLPTPVFWPGAFHGPYRPWGCKESDTTELLSLSLCIFCIFFFRFFSLIGY